MDSLFDLTKTKLNQFAIQLNKELPSDDKIQHVRTLKKTDLVERIRIKIKQYHLHSFLESYYNNTDFIDVSLANVYNPDAEYDFKNFYVSEKYDGYRAYLKNGLFRTREKTILTALRPFSELIHKRLLKCKRQDIILDGELWFGRGTFHTHASSLNSKTLPDYIFDTIQYKVFDYVSDEPYYERYQTLESIINCLSMDSVSLVKQFQVHDKNELQIILNDIVRNGGEGLMLRDKNKPYIHKRSNSLLKIKPIKYKQMVVVGYKMGNNKYKNMLGSLIVTSPRDNTEYREVFYDELPCAEKKKYTFVSGMDDESRLRYKSYFPIGLYITVAYTETTPDGNLRHPRIAHV